VTGQLVLWRSFVFSNALIELRQRYAGTAMGILWHVVQPLGLILVFAFVFSEIMPSRGPAAGNSAAFAVVLSAGLLPWLAFADACSRATSSLVDNAHYLRKIALPEWLFVLRSGVGSLVVMMISVALVITAAVVSGTAPRWTWLTIPLVALLFSCLGVSIGLLLSPLHVFVRDTAQVLGLALQFAMWLSPVIVLEASMPEKLRALQTVNPAAWYLNAIRGALFDGAIPSPGAWAAMVLAPAAIFYLGYRFVKMTRSDIRDVL
jgi:lipopolysaccharide transport system permease protein